MILFVLINSYLIGLKFSNNDQRFISPYPTLYLLTRNKLFISVYIIKRSRRRCHRVQESREGGGVSVILSLPRGCYYLFYHPLSILSSHLSFYRMYYLKLLFERCLTLRIRTIKKLRSVRTWVSLTRQL